MQQPGRLPQSISILCNGCWRLLVYTGTVQGAGQVPLCLQITSQLEGGAACSLQRFPQGRVVAEKLLVEVQGVAGILCLLHGPGNVQLDGDVVLRGVSRRYEQLVSGLVEPLTGDEVVDELKTDRPAAHIAVSLPASVNRPLIVLNGLAFVTLAGCQPGQLKIDQPVTLLAFQQRIEVNASFLKPAGGSERFGQLNLDVALAWGIGQRGAEGVDRCLRLVPPHSQLATFQPSVGQLNLMRSVRLVKIVGQHGQQSRNREQGDEGHCICKDETSPLDAVVGGQRRL